MNRAPSVVVGLFAVAIGCGDSSATGPTPPTAPAIVVNGGTKELTWPPVAGADAYDVYVKTVAKDLGAITENESSVTKSDAKVANASSPLSLAAYNRCKTAYFFMAIAKNSAGESAPSGRLGYGSGAPDCAP